MFKYGYLSVPIELVQYVHDNKMYKSLGLYLLLKASCDGYTLLKKECKIWFMSLLGIKDGRSFNKHLHKLISDSWVGYNEKTGIYYIRGFKALRKRYDFQHRSAVVFYITQDAPNVTTFVHGAIINHQIKRRTWPK